MSSAFSVPPLFTVAPASTKAATDPLHACADDDWRYSCVSFWKEAVRKSRGK